MSNEEIIQLVKSLVKNPSESEWFEFKHNFHSEDEIGELISALSNSANLKGQPTAYLVAP
jgi:hypothetical protein